jgi:Zn-dependent peptidase ImmA (M78 family)
MPEQFLADTHEMLSDPDVALDPKEREANRFAAELLMPAEVCRARAEEMRNEYGCCPRAVLEYRLASELLVSAEAVRYRLKNLGVGDE